MRKKFLLIGLCLVFLAGCGATMRQTATTKNFKDYAYEIKTVTSPDGTKTVTEKFVPRPTLTGTMFNNLIKSMLPLAEDVAGTMTGK
jgi:uncharacterized lipoprotein